MAGVGVNSEGFKSSGLATKHQCSGRTGKCSEDHSGWRVLLKGGPRARRTPAIMTLEQQWFQMAGERRFLQGLRNPLRTGGNRPHIAFEGARLICGRYPWASREAASLGTSNIQRADMLAKNRLEFTLSMVQNVIQRHGVRQNRHELLTLSLIHI